MTIILGALAPIFLLIGLGWAARAKGYLTEAFWFPAERLTYFVLFPALLVANLAEARLDGLPVGGILAAHGLGTIVAATLAAALCAFAHRPPLNLDGPGASSLFQGIVRPNTFVGFALAAGLFGPPGVTLTALCVTVVLPLVNLLSVLAVLKGAHAKAGSSLTLRNTLIPVATNPIILACAAGMALNLGGIGLPPVIGPLLKILGQASLALGLLAVGAGLDVGAIRRAGPVVALAILGRLVMVPALVFAIAWAMGVRDLALAVCVIYGGLPVAPNAYVLARQLGGDAKLMAAVITMTTLAAAPSLAVLLMLLMPG